MQFTIVSQVKVMEDKFPNLVVKAGRKPFTISKMKSEWLRGDYRALKRHMRLRVSELDNAETRNHKIAVGFFESPQFNAFAWSGKSDLIALSGMVPVTLLRVFFHLLAHREVLPWIGSAQADEREIQKLDFLSLSEFMTTESKYDKPVIKDESRQRAARWLYERAIDFIIYHELGHIWNGHLRYLKSEHGLTCIDELSMLGDIGPAQLDTQTLEMDADGFAIRELLGRNYRSDGWLDPELEQATFEGATPLVLALLAPYVVFRLFQDSSELAHAQSYIHPPAALRMRMMIGYAANLIHGNEIWHVEDLDLAYKTASTAILWGEQIFELFQNDTSGRQVIGTAFGLEGSAYKRTLLANWAVIRPKLDLLRLGGPLPGSEIQLEQSP
jgi:hypothetical protein